MCISFEDDMSSNIHIDICKSFADQSFNCNVNWLFVCQIQVFHHQKNPYEILQ